MAYDGEYDGEDWVNLFTITGDIFNRTYGRDKNLYISLSLPTLSGPTYYGPP